MTNKMASTMVRNMLGDCTDHFAVFGTVAASYIAFKLLLSLLRGLKAYVLARPLGLSANLKTYGSWAVVTGCTDGIGKAYAEQLAEKGINIVLISRSKDKLQTVAKEIESKTNVQTKVIVADFGEGASIYDNIRKQLDGLDIGVLVNNVGMSYEYPLYFLDIPDRDKLIMKMLHVNVTSMVMMCSVVMPGMLERKKGAIINVSSESGSIPTPLLSVYSATKAFVVFLSDTMNLEYQSKGIISQTVMPCFVATKMSKIRRANVFAPFPDTYVKAALGTVGVSSSTNGYWAHGLQVWLTHCFPTRVYQSLTFGVLNKARIAYEKKKARQGKKE